ncbi:MAG TPA: anti-sigma factor [Dehalococcoidia bacterium]|nr:anti-sigma factor [Dehalococcoidia bacterium]
MAALLTVLLLSGGSALRVRANGVPLRIPLAYLAGLSNWGPQDATGSVEMSFAEGIVKLDAKGLPQLSGQQYQLWLVKSATNKAFSLGTFSADANRAVAYTGKISGIDGYDYDLLQITVEPVPDPDPAPAAQRSIGGFFTPIKQVDNGSGGISSDVMPASLPNTGDAPADVAPGQPTAHGLSRHALGILLIGVGATVLITTLRRRRLFS